MFSAASGPHSKPSYPIRGHAFIIDAMSYLGYSPDEEGVCFGLAYMFMQAGLAMEMPQFVARLDVIADLVRRAKKQAIKIALKENNHLYFGNHPLKYVKAMKDDVLRAAILERYQSIIPDCFLSIFNKHSEAVNMKSFFDGVMLYQSIYQFPFLFSENPPSIQNALLTMPLALSSKLEAHQGVKRVDYLTCIYTEDLLKLYFQSLQRIISGPEKMRVPLAVVFENEFHALCVQYYPPVRSDESPRWYLYDPNHLVIAIENVSDLSAAIMKCFGGSCEAIRSSFYARGDNYETVHDCLYRWHQVHAFQFIHSVTEKKVKEIDSEGSTWLLIAAESNNCVVVSRLLDAGADVNHQTVNCRFPLMKAVLCHDMKMAALLLSRNADVNLARLDDSKESALHAAVRFGLVEMSRLLLSQGANANQSCSIEYEKIKSLFDESGSFDQLNDLFRKDDVSGSEWVAGVTPLHLAVLYNRIDLAELLLDYGADPAIKSPLGVTALHLAEAMQREEIAGMLKMADKENLASKRIDR